MYSKLRLRTITLGSKFINRARKMVIKIYFFATGFCLICVCKHQNRIMASVIKPDRAYLVESGGRYHQINHCPTLKVASTTNFLSCQIWRLKIKKSEENTRKRS